MLPAFTSTKALRGASYGLRETSQTSEHTIRDEIGIPTRSTYMYVRTEQADAGRRMDRNRPHF